MRTATLAAALCLLAAPALAQKSADTLRVSWRDALPTVDPYYNQLRTGLIVAFETWDCLLYRDPDTLQLKPALAQSWRQVDPTTIDFTLRPGITFQNGDAFTAADVVYTVNTILADKTVAVPSNYGWLAGATEIDPMHVRIKLARVFPAALEYMAMTLPIYPAAYRTRVGAAGYAAAPIGTGPYRITRIEPNKEIDFERYDHYFAESPKGRPAIKRIVVREVPDEAAELADLLDGRADWIWDFDPDQFNRVARVPTLVAERQETMRVAYLSLDAAGRSDPGGPLTHARVRRAIAHAIDRGAMARQLMQGGSRVLDAPCYPSQFGCDQASATHYAYDPALAKTLLSDAGFAGGFKVDLVSYVMPSWAVAVRSYLKAVGIDATISQLSTEAAVRRADEGRAPLNMGSWGSYSINDVSAFLPYFFTGGGNDYARDPAITRLVEAGGDTTDPDQRRIAYTHAIQLITAGADWLPLFTYVKTYGYSRALKFHPYQDEVPRFYLCSWR